MAITIATGFVVDDAIVVMENVARHLESGMSPFAAALKGAQEIVSPSSPSAFRSLPSSSLC